MCSGEERLNVLFIGGKRGPLETWRTEAEPTIRPSADERKNLKRKKKKKRKKKEKKEETKKKASEQGVGTGERVRGALSSSGTGKRQKVLKKGNATPLRTRQEGLT